MIYIFYHKRDLDGYCSGAITRYYHEKILRTEVKMYPFDYGDDFPFDEIKEGSTVLMVDVTVNPYEVLEEVARRYKLFVIDHHKSFVGWVKEHPNVNGAFKVGLSASEIAWRHFFHKKEMPNLVRLLGRYDVWDNADQKQWWDQIMPIQMGMKSYKTDPSTIEGFQFWVEYFDKCLSPQNKAFELENQIRLDGYTIIDYQKAEDAKTVSLYAFDAEFEGMKAICLNTTRFNSQVYESVWDNTKYDIMLAWVCVQGKRYSVSLYTDKEGIDVSAIARKYDGGGHLQAAGFQCKNVRIDNGSIIIEK
jgi:oligoribonuclease NrnB/cAMP/cGMP phosphodiesterase (DHH superfamily)